MKQLINCTLLLVEDNTKAQEQLKYLLTDYFKEIYQAYDGLQALHMYRKNKPDIVLADITMPKMDGLQMAQEIRSMAPHQPIILLTGHSDQDTLLTAANIPVDGYITKPITDINQLFNGLTRVAEKLQKSRAKIQALYYQSHYDHLTRIPNRLLFSKRLAEALESARQAHSTVTLFYLDMDHLKQINDQWGHEAGNHAIKTMVKHIQDVLDSRDLFARIGGDEFALIIETMDDPSMLKALAKKILQAASDPIYYHGKSLSLTCSIGISLYPQNTTRMPELIEQADRAMYRVKSAGKNGYCFWGD